MGDLESLVEVLNNYSRCAVLEKDGSRIIVLERGARVLGAFLGDSPNLLWVKSQDRGGAEEGWMNSRRMEDVGLYR